MPKANRDQWFCRHEGRSLNEYESLLGIDIGHRLGPEGFWIDLGTDTRAFAMGQLAQTQRASLLGVSNHEILAPPNVKSVICDIPKDVVHLQPFAGQARLVTDLFGPTSYANDPVAVLLSCVQLLDRNGEFRIVTECERLDFRVMDRLQHFLRRRLAVNLDTEVFQHKGRYTGTVGPHLRITLSPTQPFFPEIALMLDEARAEFGAPISGDGLWESGCGSVEIRQIRYSGI